MAKRILSEIDLLPNGIKSTPAKTAWEALSNGLVNIQQAMKYRETERIPDARSAENGRRHVITQKDVEDVVRYIKITINNCLSSTFPKLMFKESITKQDTNMKTENRKRNVVRLTESRLTQIVAESVKKVLKEWDSDDETAYDMNGNEIHMGDYVIWVDPETGRRTKYEVYDEPSSEMVRLANKYGECEALPEECIVIKRPN